MRPSRRAPRWFVIVLLVSVLPVFQLPLLLSYAGAGSPARVWLWIYPIYLIVAACLASQCYPQRRALAWVLIALMWITHAAMWTLCLMPVE